MCAGDKDHWSGFALGGELPIGERIGRIHERIKARKEKKKKKKEKEEGQGDKKEEKGGMGLQLLFGGMCTCTVCRC